MSLIKFVASKSFLKQLGLAVVVLILLVFGIMQWLKVSTNHGEYIEVPDLSKKTINEVQQVLEDSNLNFVVLDSTNFNPAYPRYSVIEQNPPAGNKVKEGRKIYLTINPSGYRKVSVPKVIQETLRTATSIIKAVGLEVGEVTYVDNIGKDMVLGVRFEGKDIQPGDLLPKKSKIDLVCGNGNK
ncbi:PASTA domain-containing protein [Zhouia amylolytica]|uniref:PASTA domain-containing protein n=2 Tax=Zhouia amylolytica TaxID=376730 RepID=A0A1I6TQP9_9FLAO|nr:PASTA domain-containing protein [Zhouia amylolytica]ETN96896.1 putative Non-specific serine/threonine protein kinase [Zhouia amylolytica AD3]MCQ0113084.1 PASTA domain-containing protein [Zhouia amylolytica]SFS91448.1 PASTA domain-containing protein [Zhouia amylolytica]